MTAEEKKIARVTAVLAGELYVGAKVRAKHTGMVGYVTRKNGNGTFTVRSRIHTWGAHYSDWSAKNLEVIG